MFTYGQTNEEPPEKFTWALKSKMFYHRNMHFTFIKKTNTIKASLFIFSDMQEPIIYKISESFKDSFV